MWVFFVNFLPADVWAAFHYVRSDRNRNFTTNYHDVFIKFENSSGFIHGIFHQLMLANHVYLLHAKNISKPH